MFRFGILGNEAVVFVLRVARTVYFLLFQRVHHLLVFGSKDEPAQFFLVAITRVVAQRVLRRYLAACVVIAQVCSEVVRL